MRDMSKPFQFSIARMLGTVALLGVAMRMIVLFLVVRFNGGVYPPLLFIGIFAAGGAAVGCIQGRPFMGALYGGSLGAFFVFMWLLLPPVNAARE
jgi:hypothetical protein